MTKSDRNLHSTELDGEKQDLDPVKSQNNCSQTFKLIDTELNPETEQVLNALEPILQASNKKEKATAIVQAAEILGKNPRTIKRMLARISQQGVATLAKGREDKGQYRISKQWRDFILKLYKWGHKEGAMQNINQIYNALMALATQGVKLRTDIKKKDGYAKLLKPYPQVLEDLIARKHPSHPTSWFAKKYRRIVK